MHDSDELKQYCFSSLFFAPIWRLSLRYYVVLCCRMWLMVILCMVPGFLLCCTWVLLCNDTRERGDPSFFVVVDVFIPFFSVGGGGGVRRWIFNSWPLTFPCRGRPLWCWRTDNRPSQSVCLPLLISLLSLFGPCLESQCALCGEPEGEWASPTPLSKSPPMVPARHPPSSPGLLLVGRQRGRAEWNMLLFSLHPTRESWGGGWGNGE